MLVRLLRLFAFIALISPICATPAHAQFRVCNKTPAPVSVAIAFETTQDVVSQGWWTVDPDNCTVIINSPLEKRYYYHYIISNALKFEWRGTYEFCTSNDPQFRINGSQDCAGRSYLTTGFRQTDVGTNKEYTLNIRTNPVAASEITPVPNPATAPATNPPPVVAAPQVDTPLGVPATSPTPQATTPQ